MKNAVFITGATGFLGTEIVKKLIEKEDQKIYVLVRAKDQAAAYHRLRTLWYHAKELYNQIGIKVYPVAGDFTLPGLGLRIEDKALLKDEVEIIYHSGAEIGLQKTGKDFQSVNIEGTKHVINLAKEIPHIKKFLYVSTAYVAGQKTGKIPENTPEGDSYSSLYEKSKAEAELLLRNSSLPWSICRPGMIVGDSKSGRVKNFNTIYYILKQILLDKMPLLPVEKDLGLNLVPVDYVADSAIKIAESEESTGKTYHLTCPLSMQPTAEELVNYVSEWAKEHLGIRIRKPVFAPLLGLKAAGLTYNLKVDQRKKNPLTNLITLVPYFYGGKDFDRSNADHLLGKYPHQWRDYIDPLLEYACRKNFMQQTERSVFEQAQFRRESKHYPINYYDVRSDGILHLSGSRVNQRILKIKASLWAFGIRKGDKVALSGINSIEYMMLDQAIGLIGAVSVPIYYTTPVEEIALLLERSGACSFFIGDKRIMADVDRLDTEIPLIAFSQAKECKSARIIPFSTFLKKGRKKAPSIDTDPEDLATIRYTSGTTGEPKGVMFNYQQLAWMGEVLTNLLSWKGRNQQMRYLSFLPESHVVEGILASYAPYYMLAKIDFYFLNDFASLVDALPKVRPTVFFSVPRFYEKLWEQLASNKLGQKYLSMPDGPAKRAMAALLKKVILKKAGLDACEQLIVGSAPISESLLQNFRALGIEIHNAYGQTEAPLITINRLGDNVIPSIGTPLPETEVSIAADGELIVKGPQVCLGYYGIQTDTIENGLLKTGDLGSVDAQGHISLHGRKKEMIITAYGKNISIPKIEEALKNIPEISEAVLIGENRPYCTALLWTKGDLTEKELDEEIKKMNKDLSHPEQVKKYCVIDQALSIQNGELTPNLKVKRANVEAHYQDKIEEMYR